MTRQSLKTPPTLQIHDESSLPSWLTKTLCLATVGMMFMPYFLEGKPFELRMLTIIFLYAVLGHGWNILGGYAGQTSLGHGVFFGIGAYVDAILVTQFNWSPWIGMPLGALVASMVGVALGWPCFKLRGHYFVIATLVLAESIFLLVNAWDDVGSAMGIQLPILQESWKHLQFSHHKEGYYYLSLAMLVFVTILVAKLQASRFGYVLRAIRDDEDAVRSLGFSPELYKQGAMALSAAIVGLAGGFYTQYVLFVDPASCLALSLSVTIALIAILGGVGTVAGPILGACVLIPLSEYSRVWFSGTGRNLDLLIYGALIMLISVRRPNGLFGIFNDMIKQKGDIHANRI
ncbi:MAG: branched-chain amino acid ABC transporter permease [Betaproteobacteria bacterium]|nr:branched-chain amino acid ABC transporter permease [Betaproteobacteria bacterium]